MLLMVTLFVKLTLSRWFTWYCGVEDDVISLIFGINIIIFTFAFANLVVLSVRYLMPNVSMKKLACYVVPVQMS